MNYTTPFITFEGGEGSGKTTQIKLLAEWLREQGIAVTTTREPGGTEGGDAIRKLLVEGTTNRWDRETDTLLYLAARRHNLVQVIWPALTRGDWVLSDRFMDSTYAYQCFARGLDREKAASVYRFIADDFVPILTFFLDIDVKTGLDRAMHGKGRALHENRFEKFDTDFHERIRAGYHTMVKEEPNRFAVIDASADIDTVQQHLRTVIKTRFKL
jgi:dTMP kinase